MKILFINQSDVSGGAARAAYRIASKLINDDVDLTMQVMRKLGKDKWVLGPKGIFNVFLSRLLPRLDLLIKKIFGVNKDFSWSLNFLPNPMMDKSFVNSFDLIHIHWVGKNMLPLNWISNFKKPVVWTLHDGWAFTGGCHIPSPCIRFRDSCGYCPQLLSSNKADVSHRVWLKKSTNYIGAPFHFIAPSNWILELVRESSLLKKFPVTVIPNGLDTSVFSPLEKIASRKLLGIPSNKKIILYGAMHADTDKNKGMDLLIDALHILTNNDINFAKKNFLVVFGTNNESLFKQFPLPVVCLGMIADDNKLVKIYSSADLSVVPSRSEAFGQVAAESLSCGTPVVAFNTSGLRDIVDHMETGYLANSYESEDLARGIKIIIENRDMLAEMSLTARKRVLERFDIAATAKMHLDLYKHLLES